mmetsp:Transcript_98505/g.257329  ORF Transcript_98505/g.257329 Transcript_98505/m.257329 type:complete len:275 (+) Transcript_98505:894-1718(+)
MHVRNQRSGGLLLESQRLQWAVHLPLLRKVASKITRNVLLQPRELEGVELDFDWPIGALLPVSELEDRGTAATVHGKGQLTLEAAGNIVAARHVDPEAQLWIYARIPIHQQLGLLWAWQGSEAAVATGLEGDDDQVPSLLDFCDLQRVAVHGAYRLSRHGWIEFLRPSLHRIQAHHSDGFLLGTSRRIQYKRQPPMIACILALVILEIFIDRHSEGPIVVIEQTSSFSLRPIHHVLPAILSRSSIGTSQLLPENGTQVGNWDIIVTFRWDQPLA